MVACRPSFRRAYRADLYFGFVLAEAGLLNGKKCTTHWKLVDRLAREYPELQVAKNQLFVHDGRVVTSAGVSSGIDMALYLIELHMGPLLVARVAREMVMYLRRNGEQEQESIYLKYRTHLNDAIHRVQDWIVMHPEQSPTVERLSGIAHMSSRHLTRSFREATGISLKEFVTRVKMEVAIQILRNPEETIESTAHQCGYGDARQLRRLFQKYYGQSPSAWQRHVRELDMI